MSRPTDRRTRTAVAAGALVLGTAAMIAARRRTRYSFAGRTALITGGSRGLGLALARELGREGARVVLCARSIEALQAAAADLASRGVRVDIRRCDVRDPADVAALVADLEAAGIHIDVLVNNAGVIQMEPFAQSRDADFDESLRTHFWGPLHLIRAVLPGMQRRRSGRIINISSIGGRISVPHLLPYAVGKFALSGLSDGLSAELAGTGIVVTTVTPGLMRTGSHRNAVVRGNHKAEAVWFGLGSATPLTSMRADRAAREIVRASRSGRRRVSPGWQARAAEVASALFPNVVAAAFAAAAAMALPGPGRGEGAEAARVSRDLDLGWPAALMANGAAADLNQPLPRQTR